MFHLEVAGQLVGLVRRQGLLLLPTEQVRDAVASRVGRLKRRYVVRAGAGRDEVDDLLVYAAHDESIASHGAPVVPTLPSPCALTDPCDTMSYGFALIRALAPRSHWTKGPPPWGARIKEKPYQAMNRCHLHGPATALLLVALLLVAASPRDLATAAAERGEPRATTAAAATRPSHPFAFVLIDAKTEQSLGPFPYDRSVYAKAVAEAAAAGARGVVLKFFLDQPKTEAGDLAFVEAMAKTRVILQARVDDTERRPNTLPGKFTLGPAGAINAGTIGGNSGWIPLPDMAARAHAIGFIDNISIERMPLVERYRGDYVKSLFTCCLELAFGESAQVTPGKVVRFGSKVLALDAQNHASVRYPAADDLQYIPLVDVLVGRARPALKDRVVVIGWDGPAFEPIDTPMGKVRPHRVFCYALLSLYEQTR